MTELLAKAFAEASKLPQQEQDTFAKWILEELAAEQRWEKALSESADALSQLADEALDEHNKGKTQVLDPDKL